MSFYGNLAATAARLLAQFGQDVTIKRQASGAYDPGTGAASLGGETASTVKGLPLDIEEGVTEIRGTLVQQTDKTILLEAAANPSKDDRITVGGVTYSVLSFKSINPAGTPVLYEAHIRA